MKWVALVAIAAVAVIAWRVITLLSPDAVAMAIGVTVGVMATIPIALLRPPAKHDAPKTGAQLPAPVVVIYSNRTTNNTVMLTPEEAEEELHWSPQLARLPPPRR